MVTTAAVANAKAPSTVTKTVTLTPAPPKCISDGTYTVPAEVKPVRPKGSDTAVRLEFEEILANGNPDGPTTITIKATDKAFETHGCQDWVRVK